MNNYKQKIIYRTKILNFCKTIGLKIAKKNKLWGLIKWIKIKSHDFNELLKLPTLTRISLKNKNKKLMIFFENKIRFLVDEFFSTSSPADLSDISGATYSMLIYRSPVIMKNEVIQIIKKLNFNKIFDSNDINTCFWKVCENG